MANSSIEIEIVADFKDNATGKVKALNAELDKLKKRNVNVDITATDRASKAMESINGKLSKVDGTKTATDEIDKAVAVGHLVLFKNSIEHARCIRLVLDGADKFVVDINSAGVCDIALGIFDYSVAEYRRIDKLVDADK